MCHNMSAVAKRVQWASQRCKSCMARTLFRPVGATAAHAQYNDACCWLTQFCNSRLNGKSLCRGSRRAGYASALKQAQPETQAWLSSWRRESRRTQQHHDAAQLCLVHLACACFTLKAHRAPSRA